ncbi:MAG: SUF system NifU family Fe-S cluster assembly protein [Gammaproteobacteria bacterium]|jgi:nitrogen fixation NifU-like protein
MIDTADNSATELQSIYRQRVLDYSRNPHNFYRPKSPDRQATGFNPLCGDKVTVYINTAEDQVVGVAFEGTGCAICISSASMMTDAINQKSVGNALQLIADIKTMFSEGTEPEDPSLQEMLALTNVRSYPSRIKCATLAWNTAEAALKGDSSQVSTEDQDN